MTNALTSYFLTVWEFGAIRLVSISVLLFIGFGEIYPQATPQPMLSEITRHLPNTSLSPHLKSLFYCNAKGEDMVL